MESYISKEINIGNLSLGGANPVRIQSMTSTDTMDTEATVEQSIRMIEAGCEMVRITAQGIREARHLAVIKDELKRRGYDVPLIADIHFNPKAAETAALIVEKVRINPGNYIDKNRGKVDYTDAEYETEIKKIKERITPLITICKEHNTAIRIGSNHGSLSERILARFGDTPEGMVESAMEFVRICRELDFHNLVLSMKASNVKIMVQANRLLVKKMQQEGINYPVHLGVTEAGDAEDGRIKSAAGIATLLADGIGDTIRVSLTEEPEYEIPVAKMIIDNFGTGNTMLPEKLFSVHYSRRISEKVDKTGDGQVPVVVLSGGKIDEKSFSDRFLPDYIFGDNNYLTKFKDGANGPEFIALSPDNEMLAGDIGEGKVIVIDSVEAVRIQKVKQFIVKLIETGIKNPVILRRRYSNYGDDEIMIKAAGEFAYLLIDGLLDGIWIESGNHSPGFLAELSFGILQATGDRISKTEYIACPSCGRTLFNIQQTLQRIKAKTAHLKGLKIGVMGCIVNGPGEMADADYGYVGAGKGKVTLYKGRQVVRKNIDEKDAVDELIRIINEDLQT
jgi:(E)-4-hydroxy-3-methylbut-2-enyl-diphosphate synthase